MLTKFCTGLLDLLFPSRCLACQSFGQLLCRSCLDELPPAEPPQDPENFAIFPYHEPLIKKAVWHLKYQNGFAISKELGRLLYEGFIEQLAEQEQIFPSGQEIIVIPIPLSKSRKRERGYNQAEKLAQHFVAQDKQRFLLLKNNLIKTRDTASQMSIHRADYRQKNLRGSMKVKKPAEIKGRTIIVIDDVLTTGATIAEARRTLGASGARRVYGLALAHG